MNNPITERVPRKPNSSPSIEKIKSVKFTSGDIHFDIKIDYKILDNNALYSILYRDDKSRHPTSTNKNICIQINHDHEICREALHPKSNSLYTIILMLTTLSITEIMLLTQGNNFARLIGTAFNEQLSYLSTILREDAI